METKASRHTLRSQISLRTKAFDFNELICVHLLCKVFCEDLAEASGDQAQLMPRRFTCSHAGPELFAQN